MTRKLAIRIDCVPSTVPFTLKSNEDILFFHVEEGASEESVIDSVKGFSFSKNLKVVMTSGFMSEILHDVIDDTIETSFNDSETVLTMWSEGGLAESIWEFINVHGDADGIRTARLTIITARSSLQSKILEELGYKND